MRSEFRDQRTLKATECFHPHLGTLHRRNVLHLPWMMIEREFAKPPPNSERRLERAKQIIKGEELGQQVYARNEKTKSVPSQAAESEGDCVVTEVRKLWSSDRALSRRVRERMMKIKSEECNCGK